MREPTYDGSVLTLRIVTDAGEYTIVEEFWRSSDRDLWAVKVRDNATKLVTTKWSQTLPAGSRQEQREAMGRNQDSVAATLAAEYLKKGKSE